MLDVYEIKKCKKNKTVKLDEIKLITLGMSPSLAKEFFSSRGILVNSHLFKSLQALLLESGKVPGKIKYIAFLEGALYALVESAEDCQNEEPFVVPRPVNTAATVSP